MSKKGQHPWNYKGGNKDYNLGFKCEVCKKPTVNGYNRCKSHRIITSEMREAFRESGRKKVERGTWSNQFGKYKGEHVTYRPLHSWVERYRGKPDTCEHCGSSGFSGHQIHWANKSWEYKRDLNDWLRLCAKCHAVYDKGRMTVSIS